MNYGTIGFKAGIEIHQQLNTRKLFSRCESKLTKDVPDTLIKRKLRATKGESGKIDIAAVFETEKNLDYISYSISNLQGKRPNSHLTQSVPLLLSKLNKD